MKAGLRNTSGRDPEVTLKLQHWMREIGFVYVVVKTFLLPVKSWPLDPEDRLLGKFTRMDNEMVVQSSVKLLLAGGLAHEELPDFKAAVKWSLGVANMRGYWRGRSLFPAHFYHTGALISCADTDANLRTEYIIHGRKPAPGEVPQAPTVA